MTDYKKVILGDVFELNTKKGNIMLQYVYHGSIEFVKVIQAFYSEIPEDIESFIENNEMFVVQFPVKAAFSKKIVKKIAHANINFVLPKYMKHRIINKDGVKGWTIVDTKTYKMRFTETLKEDEKLLFPWGVWNDTLLIERLENNWQIND